MMNFNKILQCFVEVDPLPKNLNSLDLLYIFKMMQILFSPYMITKALSGPHKNMIKKNYVQDIGHLCMYVYSHTYKNSYFFKQYFVLYVDIHQWILMNYCVSPRHHRP